ncbi:MAG: lactonase family protein [Gammaproteobacteria bacterium]|jgi:6-phosphogluconolactonase|nr:lactonase family protein [Gammaproteobacteria bacterium]MBU0826543.1 lactonase family protein [Gammaproteobacteria bacterium]MBU0890600.1 lactonase family protein [Gammaproteobacteria bacterium]MBU1817788.1 lactonase family protein [Gammaproteobacteria bacterium]
MAVEQFLVVVSCADSGELHVLRLSADGQLQTVQVVTLGGQLMPMALSPDKTRLYVARRSDPLAVIGLAVDAAAGTLQTKGESALPASMASLHTDHTGRWLFSASYGADMVAVQSLGANGLAAEAATHATGRHAHCVLADPTNRFVLATSLGGGQLHRYHFDAAAGDLIPMDAPVFPMPTGTGPRHLCFNQSGDRLYVLGELDACVHVLSFDPATGALALLQSLTTLPPGFAGSAWGADLHLTPDGRWLYSSERNSHTLAGHAVDGHTGLLNPTGHWPTQATPRGFAITPDGRFLLAAGQTSHKVGVHAIDSASGALTLCAEHGVGLNPNWVVALSTAPAQ